MNEMIYYLEEVNIRKRNGMVNKCRQSEGHLNTQETGVP